MILPNDDVVTLLAAAASVARDDRAWEIFIRHLPAPSARALYELWKWQAHGGQAAPDGDWRVWLLMAGRGFGKTRAGAEWISAMARACPDARIALVGATIEDAVKVMIEGPSGLLAVAHSGDEPHWMPTHGTVRYASGAQAHVYSAAAPEKLRGPEHHYGWADELAKWSHGGTRCWDNLMMGLRLGDRPRMVVTTTPRTTALVRQVRAMPKIELTQGKTIENVHLAGPVRQWLVDTYGGTRHGRQELDGVLLEDVAEALWTRAVIEQSRVAKTPDLVRVVVGVDPPVTAEGDACGIVVCGIDARRITYVLADASIGGLRPDGWARAVVAAAETWNADRVIAEKNQGGDMVEHVLTSVEANLPVSLVSATRGKVARAEPVAARFENGRARLAGRFPELEDELAGLKAGGGYEGPGRSPDRADAMVWAISALIRPRPSPRVRNLDG